MDVLKESKNWLITGGCGFIGTALIRKILLERPEDGIRVLDNLSVGSQNDLAQASKGCVPERVELMVGDVKNSEACLSSAQGIDVMVHLAANTGVGPSVEDPVADMEANVRGTLNMLEAARHEAVERFIFASSGAPVGEADPPIHEELPARPVSPYGASKLSGEGYCSAYFRSFGVQTVGLRFGNVYGPGSTKKLSVVAKFIKQALAGETCEIYGDGQQTRDFIFINDLLGAIVNAAKLGCDSNAWGEVFQIATNREHTLNELVKILETELKTKGIALKTTHGAVRLGDVKRNYSDTAKAARILNWSSEVSLEEGIAQTVEWFLKNYNL